MKPDSRAWIVTRVTGLAVIGLLQAYWLFQPIPILLKLLIAAGVVLSLVRPAIGLLVFAGLAPVSTAVALLCGAGGLGGRMLEQLALGVVAGVLVHMTPAEGRTRIGWAAGIFAMVALASAAAMAPAAAAPIMRHLADPHALAQQLADPGIAQSPLWEPLFSAVTIAACALLGWAAERTVRRTGGLAARLVTIGLIGAAATTILSLQKLIAASVQAGHTLQSVPRLLLTVRFSQQTDVNAAASALLLAGIAGLGLLGGTVLRRVAVGMLVAIVAAGVWIAGSRIAIAMSACAALVAMAQPGVGVSRRRRLLLAGIAVIVVGSGAWLFVSDPTGRNGTISYAVGFRRLMFGAGVQMFESAPVFGVGIHKFYVESSAYVGDALTAMGWIPRENAHNNFMQVLAEEGVVGLASMIWWLGVVLISGARARLANPDLLRGSLLLAIAAAVGTWLTGHPLLVPEFAFVFWLYCGVLTGTTEAPPPSRARWLPWILSAGLIASVPLRALALRNAADLEHRGLGLSEFWLQDDAQRYREAGSAFTIFLPATGLPVYVPVRRAPGAPSAVAIEIRMRGRLLNQIPVTGDAWRNIPLIVPAGSRRFEAVDFLVRDLSSGAAVTGTALRVGLDVVR